MAETQEAKAMNKRIGFLLQFARESRRVTQQEMAEKIGISKNHISALERGEYKQPISMLLGYCNVLKMSPNDILEWLGDAIYVDPELMDQILGMDEAQQKKLIEIIKLTK